MVQIGLDNMEFNRAIKQEICPVCGDFRPIGTVHRSGKHLLPYEEVYKNENKKPIWKF